MVYKSSQILKNLTDTNIIATNICGGDKYLWTQGVPEKSYISFQLISIECSTFKSSPVSPSTSPSLTSLEEILGRKVDQTVETGAEPKAKASMSLIAAGEGKD